jgi:hypothetical protein
VVDAVLLGVLLQQDGFEGLLEEALHYVEAAVLRL